jgi:DNA-binding transcriptional LysR family regulator
MTQSAMSRLVKSLEDELGVTLLHRKGKAVVPTAEGRVFYEHAKKILEDFVRMEQDIGMARRSAKGALRMGSSRTPAAHLLPQVLYEFSKLHSGIRIDLSVCKTSSVLRDLQDGKIDVGIAEGTVASDGLVTEAFTEDEVVVIVPEDHPLTGKKTITVQDLSLEPFLLPDRGSGTRELIESYFSDAGVDPRSIKVRMTLGSPELIVQMVQAGLGIAFASKWSVFSAIKEGSVELLKTPGRRITRKFYLISASRQPATASAAAFCDFIRQYKFFIPF